MKYFTINNKPVTNPIIQGGMGIGISFHKLVTAALEAGIVGTLSSAQAGFKTDKHKTDNLKANLDAIKNEIDLVRAVNPDGILGVNVMHATDGYDHTCKFLANCDIDFIVSGAGLPTDLPEYLKDSNVKGAVIVSSGRSAKVLLRRWDRKFNVMPEFVVVEGPLAGGHLGFTKEEMATGKVKNLEQLCTEVIEVVNEFSEKYSKPIPVIAAGGVFTKEDIQKFLDLGCQGVQIATRFIATEECDAADVYKQMIVNSTIDDIVEIKSPVGYPGRAIYNNLAKGLESGHQKISHCYRCLRSQICNTVDAPYCITEKLGDAVKGDVENGLVFTGALGYKIDKITTVKELVDELTR